MDLTAQVYTTINVQYAMMHNPFLIKIFSIVPDPCLSEPCDVNAICEREGLLSDHFVCICQPPFTEGTGFNCSGMTCSKIKSMLVQIIAPS